MPGFHVMCAKDLAATIWIARRTLLANPELIGANPVFVRNAPTINFTFLHHHVHFVNDHTVLVYESGHKARLANGRPNTGVHIMPRRNNNMFLPNLPLDHVFVGDNLLLSSCALPVGNFCLIACAAFRSKATILRDSRRGNAADRKCRYCGISKCAHLRLHVDALSSG